MTSSSSGDMKNNNKSGTSNQPGGWLESPSRSGHEPDDLEA
jgi:hypothetical protein